MGNGDKVRCIGPKTQSFRMMLFAELNRSSFAALTLEPNLSLSMRPTRTFARGLLIARAKVING